MIWQHEQKYAWYAPEKATRNSLSENDIREIVTFVDKYYDKNDPTHQTGLYNGCHLLLNKKKERT